jgi:hypothetical protein
MNCQEVQARLSDYLEKSLDAANLENIESHLSTCAICHVEADHLSECIRQVSTLPMVGPPIGFTQRVMAHVLETERQPSFWERLVFPLRIKIPIQATAVVVIGILAVYLLDKEPLQKPSLMTSEFSKSQVPRLEQSNAAPETSAGLQSAPANSNDLAIAPAQSSANPVSKAPQTKTADASEPLPANSAASVAEKRSDSSSPSLSPTESRGRASGIIAGTPVINTGAGSRQYFSPAEFASGLLRSGPVSIEPFADYEMVFRLQSQLQDQARRENPPASEKSNPRPVAGRQGGSEVLDRLLEAVADSTQPQTVWVTVPKSQYEQLKRELRALGTIESEAQIPLLRYEPGAQTNGQLQIKLTVFPVPEANRTTPSSPNGR